MVTLLALLLTWIGAAAGSDPPAPESIALGEAGQRIVTLVSGEQLRGLVIESREDEIVLLHAILGRLVVPRASVASIEPGPNDSETRSVTAATTATPEGAPAAAASETDSDPGAPASVAPPRRRVGDPPRPGWASTRVDLLRSEESLPADGEASWLGNLQAALAGINSDNDELNLRAAGAITRLTRTDKWASSFEYFLSLVNSETTDNNLLVTSVYDLYLLPSDWLVFAKLQYQYDQYQSWEHRLSGYGGLGHRIFHEHPLALTLKGGFGATHEFSGSRETIPEAYAEAALAWWIDERQTIEASINIAPDLTDFGSYRVLARLDWIFRLDDQGMAIVGGLREEYQSTVPPGSTKNDLRYYLGIRYDF